MKYPYSVEHDTEGNPNGWRKRSKKDGSVVKILDFFGALSVLHNGTYIIIKTCYSHLYKNEIPFLSDELLPSKNADIEYFAASIYLVSIFKTEWEEHFFYILWLALGIKQLVPFPRLQSHFSFIPCSSLSGGSVCTWNFQTITSRLLCHIIVLC